VSGRTPRLTLAPSLTSTAASIAAASVPSAAMVTLYCTNTALHPNPGHSNTVVYCSALHVQVLMLLVLTAIEAPYSDVSLLWAVDWFV
jgi:hypothetical protein